MSFMAMRTLLNRKPKAASNKFAETAALWMAIALLLFESAAIAAVQPGDFPASRKRSPGDLASDSANAPPADKRSAVMALSGSQWPGVIDHLLQRPLENSPASANIHISYPSFGDRRIDADIRAWTHSIADAFEEHLVLPPAAGASEADLQIDKFLNDDDMASSMALADKTDAPRFELWGSYEISRPSRNAVSVTFELWNYTSPRQGNLDVLTLNYSLITGQRLNIVDIFEKPETALALMSAWSRKQLPARLGAAARKQTLENGTEPLAENFSSLTLTEDGICINFQPWQVAGWDAGIQKLKMPLEELAEASPLLALWGR